MIKILLHFNGTQDYIRIDNLPEEIKVLFSPPIELHNYIGARYNSLFDEDRKRSGYYKINQTGKKIIEPYIERIKESIESKVINDANLWFQTENARRIYENYEADIKRIDRAEKLAIKSERHTRISTIIAGIAVIITILALILKK